MSRPPDVATFRNDDNVWVSAERDPVPYEISLSCSQVSGFLCRAKKRAAVRDAGNALLRRHSTTAGSSSLASGIVAGAKDATGKRQKTRERLVVRIDDRWVDLTGWRKAHPAGSHWIDVYKNSDATEVMYGFHSDMAMSMLERLPTARKEDIPGEIPDVTPHTYAFRKLRAKLVEEGWFKRNPFMEAGTLSSYLLTMTLAVAAAQTGQLWLAALMLAVSNTSAGWIAHDYIHGRGWWPMLMRGFGELGGGMSATWWSDKHNIHHALTNVVGVDEDLMVDPALFLWPPSAENDNPLVRRIQHLYWFFPYSLLFAIWRIDSVKVALNRKLWGEAGRLLAHYGILAALFPGFTMFRRVLLPALFISGLLTATIVTVSHISEDIFFNGPHKVDFVENQLRATRDFDCSNPLNEYLAGGMNYQIEHHLFPTMPRYKYPALQKVLKKFASENNLTYRTESDWSILRRTVNMLKMVAKAPVDPRGAPSRSDEWVLPAAQR
jgi:fatty acid desaturase